MKIILLFSLLLFPVGAFAHGLTYEPQVSEGQEFNYLLAVDPQFSVVGKRVRLDAFIVGQSDDRVRAVQNLTIEAELHIGEEVFPIRFEDHEDHYEATFRPDQPGTYTLHFVAQEEGLEQRFIVEVDEFGTSGVWRLSIIVFLALLIVIATYLDCRSRRLQQPYESETT